MLLFLALIIALIDKEIIESNKNINIYKLYSNIIIKYILPDILISIVKSITKRGNWNIIVNCELIKQWIDSFSNLCVYISY